LEVSLIAPIGASKSRIDRAGQALANPPVEETFEHLELEDVFDAYRAKHLEPLTKLTLAIQSWLVGYGKKYYIAQRLKRKPQIARKLRRFHVRLTQLQDIGGLRIIVENNNAVDELSNHIEKMLRDDPKYSIKKPTDYREKGRDRTGYRAVHRIVTYEGVTLEIQIRSRIQHYWAENIEKTSVIYGHQLKEEQGHKDVISYFKALSDIFFDVELGRSPDSQQKLDLEVLRQSAESIILSEIGEKQLNSFVNEDILKTLAAKEGNSTSFSNWLLVFNWNTATFETWDSVDRDSAKAVEKYVLYEKQYTTELGYEVVLIGSSDISTVQETHSHYFGISPPDSVLESLDDYLVGISSKMDLGIGARKILSALYRKKYWSTKAASEDTLRNHFCSDVPDFDDSLKSLIDNNLVAYRALGGISLNVKSKNQIEQYI
jgi:ppGpp synthetase/RelA/SpoT-type nucleotidyltranferase